MNRYTDKQREKIALKEYNTLEIGKIVTIDEGQTPIGYASDFYDSFSGLQVYVVTDIKLPEQPTPADYAKVKHVTLLYRGSIGLNKIVDNPAEVLADWGFNDIPMAFRIIDSDNTQYTSQASDNKEPTVQLREAAAFINYSLDKYPTATFDLYGHSLGSMNVQYALASIKEKNLDRISEAFIYNGPNIYSVLDEKQRQKVQYLHSHIYNYVDPHDLVGIGYNQSKGAVGQVFVVNTKCVNSITKQHMWGGYDYDAYGNMIDKDGKLVRACELKSIDIDGDGNIDINLNVERFSPRNLFLSDMPYGIIGSDTIHINPDTLNQLAKNIQTSVLQDLQTLRIITEKCQVKNAAIQSKFEERKQQVSEKIKDSLATYGLTAVFSSLENSLKRLVDLQELFESLSLSGPLRNPFSYDETPYVHGTCLDLALCDLELHRLKSKARSVSQSCQNERAGW